MRLKTGIAFALPVSSGFCVLSLASLVLGSVVTRAGSWDDSPKSALLVARELSGTADPVVALASNRTLGGIERRSVQPLDLEGYTGYWILEESKRDTLSSRSPAGDSRYQLSVTAAPAGPHTYVGSLKLQEAFARPGPGQTVPTFTYEAVGTIAFDDPPSVVPNGTNWDVSLGIILRETCSESWSETANAITARLGALPPLATEGDRPRHVNCWAIVTGSQTNRTRAPGEDSLAPTGPTCFSAADSKPWGKFVPVRFPRIPETTATTAERFILVLDACTPAGTFRERHAYRWTKDLPKTLESQLQQQVGRVNFQGVRSGRPETSVRLQLTCPAGPSPKVFTSGWMFGAECFVSGPDGKSTDVSGTVRWSGTGTFTPATGPYSRPVFKAPGANSITLSVQVGGKVVTKTYPVTAVSPTAYACMGDRAVCHNDAHGCPACPHPVSGPITTGSPYVAIGGKPAARIGEKGAHAACCGPNLFEIIGGDPEVLIDGRPAAKLGSATKHCGGSGTIIKAGP
jgi:uncharacterized Zn-binding protein involved in type VI secretion